MEALRNAAAQAQRIWRQSSRGNQIAIVLLALASIAAVVGVGIWSTQPQYHPLVDGLSPSEAGEIVSRLEGSGISYELNYNGSVVSVPKADLGKARIAAGDRLPERFADDTSVGGSLIETPDDGRERRLREKARQLERTIALSSAIEHARVHISHNESGPFVPMGEESASASVVLSVTKGQGVGRGQADNIARTIAHGVKGVSIENVSVTDTNGRDLRDGGGLGNEKLAEQLAYVRQVENLAKFKAEQQLLPILGPDKVIVNVSAVVDFQTLETKITTYDADGKVIQDEDTLTESGTSVTPGGRTGVAANTGAASRNNKSLPSKRETTKNTYKVPETTETITAAPGVVKRMTIAATVDLSGLKDEAGKPKLSIDAIKELIKSATGFDESRDDMIQVVEAPLATTEPDTTTEAPIGGLDSYTGLLQNLSLGLASVVAFVFGFMTLKRIKPISVPAPTAAAIRKEQLVSEISAKADDDPEAVSRIVAAWLNEPAPGGTTASPADTGDDIRAAA